MLFVAERRRSRRLSSAIRAERAVASGAINMGELIKSYGERLEALIAERGPLCVGVDPHPGVLSSWGLPADARGLERCARGMVDALGAIVPVVQTSVGLLRGVRCPRHRGAGTHPG